MKEVTEAQAHTAKSTGLKQNGNETQRNPYRILDWEMEGPVAGCHLVTLLTSPFQDETRS